MKKLFLALLVLSSCVTVNKTAAPQDGDYEERPWSGPGLYWGVYINNEADYWNNYNYYHNHDNQNNRRGGYGREGEGRPGGEGGRAGGGSHGGGHR